MQQRGIPPMLFVDRVLRYGREFHDHHGATVYLIDRRAKPDRARRRGPWRRARAAARRPGRDATDRTIGPWATTYAPAAAAPLNAVVRSTASRTDGRHRFGVARVVAAVSIGTSGDAK
ncbi:MAG: hypothetical protein IPG84_12140 [Betaproteobacteria bacterium]|nr:hypothetical protein [Betaproteobacteria bacterium]